jgi:hypothetical protein
MVEKVGESTRMLEPLWHGAPGTVFIASGDDFGDTLGYAVCLVSRLENAATHVWQSSLNCSCVFSSAAVAPMSMSAAYHLLLATSEIP